MPYINTLTHEEAKEYFLENGNYANFDVPPYINFDTLLQKLSAEIGESPLSSYFRVASSEEKSAGKVLNPKDYEGVNYKLISNKDGSFGWRPLEIIHPAIYVALVHYMTSEDSWEIIKEAFQKYKESVVVCESIPYKSDSDDQTHKAEQIKRWWTNVEQAALKKGLEFQYVYDADISDCYGSIYTHSVSWALHTKEIMKDEDNRRSTSFLGNRIDWRLMDMRNGQTNGIPQGSALMDFIAEMVLGYIDTLLTNRIKDISSSEYAIIRYRDDYKIMTNRPEYGHRIVKDLSEVLSTMGMHLNTKKTRMQSDPILASIKEDKIYELFIPRNRMSLSKWLTQIYYAIDKYPNSGLASRQLDKYYKALNKAARLGEYDDVKVMISVVVNIAVKNPRIYSYCMAILSKLIEFCEPRERLDVIADINKKFKTVPNTGLLDIWLQRVSYNVDHFLEYDEQLTQIVSAKTLENIIWDCTWLKEKIHDIVRYTPIIDRDYLASMESVIPLKEVALFNPIILS